MQTDYQAAMAEQQAKEEQRYQQTRDPFEYGRQVAQRRYSEIMSDLDRQRAQTAQSYSDLYSAARQQAVRGQAAGGPTLSGGMGQQQRDYISSIEMQELGRIGTAREGAMRDLYTQAQSAMSNAQLEGQQATQIELQNQQTQLELVRQRQAILEDDKLSDEQRAEQLAALGVEAGEVAAPKTSFGEALTKGLLIGGGTTAGGIFLVNTAAALGKVTTVIGMNAATGGAALGGLKATMAAAGVKGLSGAVATGLASVPGWGWAALAAVAIGATIYAVATT
jgi:hypothetical protein